MTNPWSAPLHQGDVLPGVRRIPEFTGMADDVHWQDVSQGVVVISQTCDALRDPRIQVAPIVELFGEMTDQAQSGRRPQYAPLTVDGALRFADLSRVVTLDRGTVASEVTDSVVPSGFADEAQEKFFRDLVGRHFARFPFPDAVTEWCRPLSDKVAPKVRHANSSPQGARLEQIKEIRVTSLNGWNQLEFDLEVHFIFEPGVLPEPDRELTFEERESLGDLSADQLASRISALARDSGSGASALRAFAWEQLIDRWIAKCNDKYRPKQNEIFPVRGTGFLFDMDDYSYSLAVRSEQLDLDYLSHSVEGQTS